MASEDVIELGSSDDEAEPVTKKMKPTPNAMVHIPDKIHSVTIKPTKSIATAIPKALAGKNVTVTKIVKNNVVSNPYAAKRFSDPKNKFNGKPVKIPIATLQQPKPVPPNKISVNPLNLMKKINSQVVINKVVPPSQAKRNPIKIHSPRTLNRLPPSITVTKTSGGTKRMGPVNVNPIQKKQKLNRVPKTPQIGQVLTVELDDDDVSSASTASPQWYVRPEDQTTAEEENNKEPEKPLYVEITIEDSPVKPPQNKRTHEVGAELAITIDDSPVKNVIEKSKGSGSDEEVNRDNKDKHSKKKLEYPKETVTSQTIEIEITPCVDEEVSGSNVKEKEKDVVDNVIEIEESPLKVQSQQTSTSTPKKDHSKPRLESSVPLIELQEEDDELKEFHPVYRNFINLCFQLENSEDMKKIVEKKIKTYYKQVPKDYTESEEFIDMVSSKIVAMKAGPEKMYLYIKDIVDELNLQRKLAKSQVLSNIEAKATASDSKFLYGDDSEYDSKRQRQIRKLEKTLKKLHRAIQKLEEQEVDFDDDEDSVYLLTESDEGSTSNKDSDKQLVKDPKALLQRYKERMVRVHAKFCQLTNTKMPSEPRVQIDARPGQPQGPAKRLEKWINKKVPIGTPLPFPDFHDVLRCVREANEEDKLGWNEVDIMEEARDLFTRCGKKLQRRRQENEWRLAASRITVDGDPAEKSEELKRKLAENKKLATKKESEVFNKYADRQNQLKLEAEEIGDKEADESPVESDDDEPVDETSLQNTEKRKERLKRLLQEKSKKAAEDKCSDLNKESENIQSIDIDDKDNDIAVAKESEEKSTVDIIASNEIKEKSQSVVQEDNNEDNKENQLSLTDETKKEVKSDDKNNRDENGSADKAIINRESFVSANTKANIDDSEKIHSLSDDSNKLESDVDELHLLQKLHSENEMYSTSELSGYDTPIAISDTLGSSEDSKKQASGVISIENSSYSESEVNKDSTEGSGKSETNVPEKVEEDLIHMDTEIECSTSGVEKKVVRTNNDEYNESIEDILLASTDEETEVEKNPTRVEDGEAVNLKDDSISIGDTLVEGAEDNTKKNNLQKQEDTHSVESVTLVSESEANEVGNSTLTKESENITEQIRLENQEDTNSIESVTLVSVSEASNDVDSDKQTKDSESNTKKHLQTEEDTSSVESVHLVSSEAVNEVCNKRSQNDVTESESKVEQQASASVDSLDANCKDEDLQKLEEKSHENQDKDTVLSTNTTNESTLETKSTENTEMSIDINNETDIQSVNLASANDKNENEGVHD